MYLLTPNSLWFNAPCMKGLRHFPPSYTVVCFYHHINLNPQGIHYLFEATRIRFKSIQEINIDCLCISSSLEEERKTIIIRRTINMRALRSSFVYSARVYWSSNRKVTNLPEREIIDFFPRAYILLMFIQSTWDRSRILMIGVGKTNCYY